MGSFYMDTMDPDCTVNKTVDFISKRWTLLILLELYKNKSGWKRYSQIKAKLPKITPKILSTRLKELKKEGMINKRVDTSIIPIKSEYSLTDSGLDFIKIIKDIKKWALKWKYDNKVCESTQCKQCEF